VDGPPAGRTLRRRRRARGRRMSSRLKAVGLAVVAAAAVMVPLYGDSRSAPITHPEWARMLLRALDLEDGLPANAAPRVVFGVLSWKESLSYPADRFARSHNARVVDGDAGRRVVAGEGTAEVAYPLLVARGGDYTLRAHLAGDPAKAVAAEIVAVGQTRPVEEFTLTPPPVAGWVEGGAAHLDRGAYTAALVLPAGAALQRVEVAPPCLAPIEPQGGWRAGAAARAEDVAVTTLQALDLQSELPPASAAMEMTASDFRPTTSDGSGATAEPGREGLWLEGGLRGSQALLIVTLPEAGLYTLSVYGPRDASQSWLADGCQKVVLCPAPADASVLGWRPVLTGAFNAGRHSFTVTLAPGASLGRVRLERKKDAPVDYLATLARLGFDAGPVGPTTRARALDAVAFIRARRAQLPRSACGDVALPQTLSAGLAEPALLAQSTQPGFAGTGRAPLAPGEVPLPGPVAAVPSPPGPPTTLPTVPTPPPVTPPTPGPPPTPLPPPPTIPPQPPGSPVTLVSPSPGP
jgi:hypothetical protein